MRRNGVLLLLIAWLGGALAAPVRAGLVTWEFGGEIEQIRDTNDVLGGALAVGSLFSGSFTFDPTGTDTDGDVAKLTLQDPLQDLAGQFSGVGFSGPIFGLSTIDVIDGAPGSDDVFRLSSSVFLNGQGLNFLLTLTDSTGTVFSSDSLSEIPPNLSDFDSATIRLLRQTGDLIIDGRLTALTPDPGSLWLLGVGSAAILRRRRRRR